MVPEKADGVSGIAEAEAPLRTMFIAMFATATDEELLPFIAG